MLQSYMGLRLDTTYHQFFLSIISEEQTDQFDALCPNLTMELYILLSRSTNQQVNNGDFESSVLTKLESQYKSEF